MKSLIYFFLFFPTLLVAQWTQIGPDIYGDTGDGFGPNYITMNSQGNRVAVAAVFSDVGAPNAGQVKVYEFIANEWIQIGSNIQGNVYASERFGASVSFSSDGNTLAIGILESGVGEGRAAVYEFDGTNWVSVGQIIEGQNTGDDLGTAISLSADGLTMAVSAPGDDGNGTSSGLVQVYELQSGNWVQVGQDIFGNEGDEQGNNAIRLNANGDILAIGAPFAQTVNGLYSGRVRLYQNQSGTWVQLRGDIAGHSAGDWFGYSLDLNADGTRIAIGILGTDDVGEDNKGSVEVYDFDGSEWNLFGNELIGAIRSNAFGFSVSLNDAGNLMVVGSPYSDPNNPYEGEIHFYKYIGQSWLQQGPSFSGSEVGDNLGFSTAITSDGTIVGVASPRAGVNGNQAGKVSVFNTESLLGMGNSSKEIILSILPNPSDGDVLIQLSEVIEELVVVNSLGQEVFRRTYKNDEKTIELDISKFSSGVYFAKFIAGNNIFVVKRILKK